MIKIDPQATASQEQLDDFDAGSLPEMCETSRVVTDELMISENIRRALVENLSMPVVEAIYDELMIHENFEKLPSPEEMASLIAQSFAILMPDLVKRVFQNALGVPRG
jgi:hypothetical protein